MTGGGHYPNQHDTSWRLWGTDAYVSGARRELIRTDSPSISRYKTRNGRKFLNDDIDKMAKARFHGTWGTLQNRPIRGTSESANENRQDETVIPGPGRLGRNYLCIELDAEYQTSAVTASGISAAI